MFKSFMHYRYFDQFGYPSTKGGLTLAIQRNGDTVTVAMAECNKADNFNRKLGRVIAEGRLRKMSPKNVRILNLPPGTESIKSFVNAQDFVQEKIRKFR